MTSHDPPPLEEPRQEDRPTPEPRSLDDTSPSVPPTHWYYRHLLPVRIGHWINVLCLPILIMSGFQIFNAHSALYWGDLAMKSVKTESGERKGITVVAGHTFDTTGVLGLSGERSRGFPGWATLPSVQWLAMGRRWHLFFAWIFVINGVFFSLYALLKGHFWRDLFPHWKDLRNIGKSFLDHLLFRHPSGEEVTHYNVLQKIAYT